MMDLIRRRGCLTEPEARYYGLQILNALRYLHANRVIHRDMKLGNLFLSPDMTVKVGDFGLATQVKPGERKHTICGTPNYIAPEILDGKKWDGHSYEADTWAFGVIMYTLLIGKPPFETAEVRTTYTRIRDLAYEFPLHPPVSEDARHLITSILRTDPRTRPSLDAIAAHRFFAGPGVLIPSHLPREALLEPPVFMQRDLMLSATVVHAMLSAPIGGLVSRSRSDAARAEAAAAAAAAAAASAAPAAPAYSDENAAPAAASGGVCPPGSAAAAAQQYLQYQQHPPLLRSSSSGSDGTRPYLATAASDATDGSGSVSTGGTLNRGGMTSATASVVTTSTVTTDFAFGRGGVAPPPVPGAGPRHAYAGAGWGPSPSPVAGGLSSGAGGVLPSGGAGTDAFAVGGAYAARTQSIAGLRGYSYSGADASRPASAAPAPGAFGAAASAARSNAVPGALPYSASSSSSSSRPAAPPAVQPYSDRDDAAASARRRPASAGASAFGAPASAAPARSAAAYDQENVAPMAAGVAAAKGVVAAAAAAPLPTLAGMLHARAPQAEAAPAPPVAPAPPAVASSSAARSLVPAPALAPAASLVTPSVSIPRAVNETLRAIRGALSSSAASSRAAEAGGVVSLYAPLFARHRVWVTTWVDYSAKYGLGYLLSNGCVGAHFNDSTKIILAPDGRRFEYVDRAQSSAAQPGVPGTVAKTPCGNGVLLVGADGVQRLCATVDTYPAELKKKVILLRHFKAFLEDQYAARRRGTDDGTIYAASFAAAGPEPGKVNPAPPNSPAYSNDGTVASCGVPLPVSAEESESMTAAAAEAAAAAAAGPDAPGVIDALAAPGGAWSSPSAGRGPLVFVKKYVRSQRCILFRLADSSVQVCFFDATMMHVSADGAVATFTDRTGARTPFYTSAVLAAAERLAQRSGGVMDDAADASVVTEVAYRLKYTKDVITMLLTPQPSASSAASSAGGSSAAAAPEVPMTPAPSRSH